TGHAPSLLHFAKKHNIYIGVDGDVTYWREKQEFIKKVPLEMLVLETDSPFLLPEPLRSQRKFLPAGRQVTNEPKNLDLIASSLAGEMKLPLDKLIKITKENSLKLFNLY
ncbi:TatD family hydrolase, partial [Candidatus Roizmanbacteria bacterium]|nr:TatD family hydrolase [Candidatus Roizmanbacteria bacterium]